MGKKEARRYCYLSPSSGYSLVLFSIALLAIAAALVSAAPQFLSSAVHNGTDDFFYAGEIIYFTLNVTEINVSGNVTADCSAIGGSSLVLGTNVSSYNDTDITVGTLFSFNCTMDYNSLNKTAPFSSFNALPYLINFTATNATGDGINTTNLTSTLVGFNMTIPEGLDGATVNFSQVTNFSNVQLTFERVGHGIINFTTPVNLSNTSNLALFASLPTAVTINRSAGIPVLQANSTYFDAWFTASSAAVSLRLLNMTNIANYVVVNKNDATCLVCSAISFDGSNITFTAVGFSNYSIVNDTATPAYDKYNVSSTNPGPGDTLYIWANWSDGSLQLYNLTARLYANRTGDIPLLSTNSSVTGNETVGALANFSYTIPANFENGYFNFTINVTDVSGNSNVTPGIGVTVAGVGPNIDLSSPVNTFNTSNVDVNFNFTAYDLDTSLTCNITTDGVVNITGIAATNGTSYQNTTAGFTGGSHTWNVTCVDQYDNSNTSLTRAFSIDTTVPAFTMQSPANGSNMTTISSGINITAIEPIVSFAYSSACGSGAFSNNTGFYPFNTTTCNSTNASRTLTINVTDHARNSNVTAFVFNVDEVAPAFTSMSFPNNGSSTTANGLNITWSLTEFLQTDSIG